MVLFLGGLFLVAGHSLQWVLPPPDACMATSVRSSPEADAAFMALISPALTTLVVALLGLAVCVVGYFVLGELQAQTYSVQGPGIRGPASGNPRPAGSQLRVGRGDSWP